MRSVLAPAGRPEQPTGSRFYTPRLSSLAEWLRKAAASRLFVYIAFTALYLVPTVWLCRSTLIWNDEFFTYYLARTPNWHTLLQATLTGADPMPPPVFYLTHWLLRIFGNSYLVLRLPALFGFWLLCICAYEIARSLVNPNWAVVAMLFPLTTDFYQYASQARGYGLVAGFTALALLCWLEVTHDRHRKVFLPLLAFSLAAAVSSHYYAVLAIFPLAMGELVRSRLRRFDLGVWIAFAFTMLPILAFLLPILHKTSKYSAHFWAPAIWSDALLFYPSELGIGLWALIGLLAVALIFGLNLRGERLVERESFQEPRPLKLWEATALSLFAALAPIAMILGKFVTHAFTYRYALSSAVALTVIIAWLLSRLAPRSLAALTAALVCLFFFVLQFHVLRSSALSIRHRYISEAAFLSQTGTQQIALDDWPLAFQLSFYAPRALASRVSYIADPANADRFAGADTADLSAIDLRPWLPVQIVSTESFLQRNPHFLAYNIAGPHAWLMHELDEWGHATLISSPPSGQFLFSMDNLRVTPDPTLVEQQRIAEAKSLFSTMPSTGPSLCVLWMEPKNCP